MAETAPDTTASLEMTTHTSTVTEEPATSAMITATPSNPTAKKPPNPPISKIEDNLYLGGSESSYVREILEEHQISAVVSITVGRWSLWRMPWYHQLVPEGHHIYVPTKDSMTHNLLPDLARMCDHIDKYRYGEITGNVLVHCDQGVSRSATVVIAYLMRLHKWSFIDTYAFVKEKRRIRPNQNFREQLQVWEAVEYKIWEEGYEGQVPKPEYRAFLERRAVRLKEAGLTGDEPVDILTWEDLNRL
ncbi:hypothetical protein AA313_de0204485 [Arthrobotrys entomopaga]|nr:hypothetical protein AA313_de0204485 [Arthrobotrys entomopaga]